MNILLHEYYYRYREERKQLKTLVDAANYTDARTRLNTAMTEHESKYSPEFLEQKRDFNFGEKIMMGHASRHLDTVIEQNDPSFMNLDGTIGHHSDIVKEALERVPKTDYKDI